MKCYLLDTNTLVNVADKAKGWEKIATKIDAAGHQNVKVSAITVFEIMHMAERKKFKKAVISAMVELLSLFDVEPLTAQIAGYSGKISSDVMGKGNTMSSTDALIAGTAMYLGLVIVSDDHAFTFPRGIVLENWLRS